MFAGLRLRLTLWYSGVLALALVLAGVILYVGVDRTILAPVDNRLHQDAVTRAHAWDIFYAISSLDNPGSILASNTNRIWQTNQGQTILALLCGGPGVPSSKGLIPLIGRPNTNRLRNNSADIPYHACYDGSGSVLQTNVQTTTLGSFVSASFAKQALQTGRAQIDTIDTPDGPIRRYAIPVPGPPGSPPLGVIELGTRIEGEMRALHQLGTLLLIIGPLALLGATAGGLFLSGRALAPARLAFARQQSFIADAAHELRTPLTLLRADAEVLLRGRDRLPPDDAELLEDIVAEVAHMSNLATTMLTLARLDAGQIHHEQDVVDLTQIAARVARRSAALAAEKDVIIQAEVSEPVLVVGDRELLEQALLILCDNAIKYNRPAGRVVIRTGLGNTGAYAEVSDTGIGIPTEHLPHLGERFYRVDKARSREAGGAGLGLSIARHIASLHRGMLTLASTVGEGTRVRLVLPSARSVHASPSRG